MVSCYIVEHGSYLPIWSFITYVTKWRRKPTVDFIHCQLFLGGFIDCLEEEVFSSEGASLFFSGKTFACSKLPPTIWNSPTSKHVLLTLHSPFSIYLRSRTSWWDRWWCWWWRVYLPTSRISAEIAKRRCKPSVDFVKSQLLLGGFSYCLEKGKALLLSRLPGGVCSENELRVICIF